MRIRHETENTFIKKLQPLEPSRFVGKSWLFSTWIRNTQVDAPCSRYAVRFLLCFLLLWSLGALSPHTPTKMFFSLLNGSLGHLYGVTAVWYANNTWSSLFLRHCGSEAEVVKLVHFTKSARFISLLGLASFRIFDCIIFCCCFVSLLKNLCLALLPSASTRSQLLSWTFPVLHIFRKGHVKNNERTHMREGTEEGKCCRVSLRNTGTADKREKKALSARDMSSLAGVSRNIDGRESVLLTRPC